MLQVFRAAWGVVVQRSRADWLMAAWLVILSATTLLSAGVIYGEAASVSELQHALLAAPPTAPNIQVRTRVAPDPAGAAIDWAITRDLRDALAGNQGDVLRLARSESFALPAQREVTRLVVFASFEGIDRHAQLVDGSWPATGDQGPVQAALSAPAAAQLKLAAGATMRVASRSDGAEPPPGPGWGTGLLASGAPLAALFTLRLAADARGLAGGPCRRLLRDLVAVAAGPGRLPGRGRPPCRAVEPRSGAGIGPG